MLSLRLLVRQPIVRIAAVSRAFSSSSTSDDEVLGAAFDAKLMSKLKAQDEARDAALDKIIQEMGPIRAAERANEEEDPQLMYRSFMACEHSLMPPHHAEPLILNAWKLDQAAGRKFTTEGIVTVRTVTIDNIFAWFSDNTGFAGLVSAIYEGTKDKSLELKQSGETARLAQQRGFPAALLEDMDNAGLLMFMVACKNDELGLLQAFYNVHPTFVINEGKLNENHSQKSSSAQTAREMGGIKCAAWLANREQN